MQKILLIINAEKPQIPCLDFAAYVANLTNSKLAGVFVQQTIYEDVPSMKTIGGTAYVEEITTGMIQTQAERNTLLQAIQQFKDSCNKKMIDCTVHNDRGIAIHEVIEESRFADYIITDAAISFLKNQTETIPSAFLKLLLKQSECPVIVVPNEFNGVDEIVFAYDGSKSAVFAIKQFTYLFPVLEDKKITLLEIKNEDNTTDITELNKLRELLMYHYNAVHYELIYGDNPKEALFALLFGKRKKWLVMGAYGRHKVFSSSTADLILKTIDQPLFIAHQ
jgi:hypothetical protein